MSRVARLERGADDETRTRDINLGKVALYQLSYVRRCDEDVTARAWAGVNEGLEVG